MRVRWWWGLVTFVPLTVVFFILVSVTDGFQSPADVEGDRTVSVASAEQVRSEADRIYAGSVWQADRRYADEMPVAERWSQRHYGIPMGGLVTLGLVGFGVALTVLAALIDSLQGVLRRRAAARERERVRAHELAVQQEKTRRAELENQTALIREHVLPALSKPAEEGTS